MIHVTQHDQRLSSPPEPSTPGTSGAAMSGPFSSENSPPTLWTPVPNVADVKRVNPFLDATMTTPEVTSSVQSTPVTITPTPMLTQNLDLVTLRMLSRSGDSGSTPNRPVMNVTPSQSQASPPSQSMMMQPSSLSAPRTMGTFPPQLYVDDDENDAAAVKRMPVPPPPPPAPVDISSFDPLLSANGPKDLLAGSPEKLRGKRFSDPGAGSGVGAVNLDSGGLLQIATHLSAIKPQENSAEIERERKLAEAAATAALAGGTTLGGESRPVATKMLSTKLHLLLGGRHQQTGADGLHDGDMKDGGGSKKGKRHRRAQSLPAALADIGVNHRKQRISQSGKSTPKAPSSPKSRPKSPLRKHMHPEKLASKFVAKFGKSKKQVLAQQQQQPSHQPLSSDSFNDNGKGSSEKPLPLIPVLPFTSGADNDEKAVTPKKTAKMPLSLANLHLTDTESFLRSSEQDPAPHQVELPRDPTELAVHVRLCRVMEVYREVDQNLDFGTFVTIDPAALESFARSGGDASGKGARGGGSFCMGGEGRKGPVGVSDEGGVLSLPHRPVAKMLVDCGADDLAVEGFFHEVGDDEADMTAQAAGVVSSTATDKCTQSRIEVAVFSSQIRRQFVVVYQGTAKQQIKPVRQRELRQAKDTNSWLNKEIIEGGGSMEDSSSEEESECRVVLPAQKDATVASTFPAFRRGYFKQGMEQRVFGLLKELAEKHPFFDVIFTGHSFGAALATIGAVRYARESSTIRTSCHVFGCPRLGGHEFRSLAHSLPNLKIIRIEYGSDPWCHVPDDTSWTHVGHAVTVSSKATALLPSSTATASSTADKDASKLKYIQAYRFDGSHRSRSLAASVSTSKRFIHKIDKLKTTFSHDGKLDHDVQSYVAAVEAFCPGGATLPWVKKFEGSGHERPLC